jgi:hypothetical protein
MEKAKVTYRGWPGHFICGARCVFHLNTLIEFRDTKVVVSTVGMMQDYSHPDFRNKHVFDTVGLDRYYETMAFHAKRDGEFYDADVVREISFESEWAYSLLEDEWRANKGHWAVVEELASKLESGQPLDAVEAVADTTHNKPR